MAAVPTAGMSPSMQAFIASSVGSTSLVAAAKAKGAAPPPPKPKPKPSRLAGHAAHPTATALYDYEAQAVGDLSFSLGDVIEVTVQGASENEWWQGKLRGKVGQFPGMFVLLLLLLLLPSSTVGWLLTMMIVLV